MYEKIWQEAEKIQLNGSDEKEIINILFSKDNLDADKENLFKGKLTFRTLIWNWSKLKPVAWSSMKKPLHYSYMELELITPLFTFPITEKITLFLYGIGAP